MTPCSECGLRAAAQKALPRALSFDLVVLRPFPMGAALPPPRASRARAALTGLRRDAVSPELAPRPSTPSAPVPLTRKRWEWTAKFGDSSQGGLRVGFVCLTFLF